MVEISQRSLQEIVIDTINSTKLGTSMQDDLQSAYLQDTLRLTLSEVNSEYMATLRAEVRIGKEHEHGSVDNFMQDHGISKHRSAILAGLSETRNQVLNNCEEIVFSLAYVDTLRGMHIVTHSYHDEGVPSMRPIAKKFKLQGKLLQSSAISGGIPAFATTTLGYLLRSRAVNIAQNSVIWFLGIVVASAYQTWTTVSKPFRGKTTTKRREGLGLERIDTRGIALWNSDYNELPANTMFSGEKSSYTLYVEGDKDAAKYISLAQWHLQNLDRILFGVSKSGLLPRGVANPFLASIGTLEVRTGRWCAGYTKVNVFKYIMPEDLQATNARTILERYRDGSYVIS